MTDPKRARRRCSGLITMQILQSAWKSKNKTPQTAATRASGCLLSSLNLTPAVMRVAG
jgi:hypothetical protein